MRCKNCEHEVTVYCSHCYGMQRQSQAETHSINRVLRQHIAYLEQQLDDHCISYANAAAIGLGRP